MLFDARNKTKAASQGPEYVLFHDYFHNHIDTSS